MPTRYADKIVKARSMIERKGTELAWYKAPSPDEENEAPWYEDVGQAHEFANVPVVIIPLSQLSEYTSNYASLIDAGTFELFVIIPGDVDFKPEYNDAVKIVDRTLHVSYLNTVMPDGTPIIHEVGLK